jgi:chemotaxis methyl-accepting protein methylase
MVRPIELYLRINCALWKRLPTALRDTRLVRWYGGVLHGIVCRRARREQYFGTFFMRNRAALEQIRRLMQARPRGAAVRVTVVGCSSGAEVYSVLWAIRSVRPDLSATVNALDISADILERAKQAVYTPESSDSLGRSIFERLTHDERLAIFDWEGERATVKPWLREGITWRTGDAADPALAQLLGPQDIVIASNFLCHMDPATAERCLRNIARLVAAGGHLFVAGVDLQVRTRVAQALAWRPLRDLIREMHEGDPSIRNDWPWEWWGVEPFDDRRRDWELRYAAAFRLEGSPDA